MIQNAKQLILCSAALIVLASPAWAAPVDPTFDTFGELSEATFGGSGIPNDAVAITEFTTDADDTITLGLTATERFSEPPVADNGAGVFTALAGGFPGSPALARWNFNFFMKIVGGGTFEDYIFELLYDFDPGVDTDESDHGVLDFNDAIVTLGGSLADFTLVEGSENLGFGFLATSSSFITVPSPSSFDPNAIGEYTFSLRAFDDSVLLGESAIQVNAVPEPISASLFGIGSIGLLSIAGVRRRRKARAEPAEQV